MRVGVVAEKIGMSRIYAIDNSAVPVTLLRLRECVVASANEKQNKDGTVTVTVAAFEDDKKTSKPRRGMLKKAGITGRRVLKSFKVAKNAAPPVGFEVRAGHFVVGQYIDVTGTSKGKGFAGGMKRHNFAGLEATHGVSISHRSHGSTGQCQDPGKVFKGKKMAGHLGDKQCTTQNLEVMHIDEENNIIAVCGAVPGSKQGVVTIFDAVKKPRSPEAPYPYVALENSEKNTEAAGEEA